MKRHDFGGLKRNRQLIDAALVTENWLVWPSGTQLAYSKEGFAEVNKVKGRGKQLAGGVASGSVAPGGENRHEPHDDTYY